MFEDAGLAIHQGRTVSLRYLDRVKRSRFEPRPSLLLAGLAIVIVLVVMLVQRMMSDAAEDVAPSYSFEDVTGSAGMSDVARSWGSAWYDLDGDRFPDAIVGRHWQPPRLFRSEGGGRFREEFPEVFSSPKVDRHGCAWGEANGDGRADIYCVQGAGEGTGTGPNQLLVRTGPVSFEDRAGDSDVSDPKGRGRTVNWLDHDGDGDLDLFVGNHERSGHPNLLLRNDDGSFTKTDAGVDEEMDTASSSWADWDDDGDPDLLVLQRTGDAAAYENHDGRFRRRPLQGGEGGDWLSGAWGDYDADGFPDLHLVSFSEARVLHNTGDGFEVVHRQDVSYGRMSTWLDVDNDSDLDLYVVQGAPGRDPSDDATNEPDFFLFNTDEGFVRADDPSWRGAEDGDGESVAAVDHDRDGRIDLFVTNGAFQWFGPNLFLRNTSQGGNWVGIQLRGPDENPMGIGARVEVSIGSKTLRHQVTDAVNAKVQNEVGYLHVGLGEAGTADVEIEWPDGSRDCRTTETNRSIVVERASEPCA